MWSKVDPRGHRVGITQPWPCEWFATSQKQSAQFFVEDVRIREFIEKFYFRAWIAKVIIRKTDKDGEVLIFTGKPATLLGKDWKRLAEFEAALTKQIWRAMKITLKEIKVPEISAKIMAEFAAIQLENRMPYRRVAKTVMQKVMEKWAQWIKIQIWGRLWWADISRSEKFTEGRVPLQTLRSDIDYHYTIAQTKYWVLWIKVWVCKWMILDDTHDAKAEARAAAIEKVTTK
jgi:small subunit ribosomal protein S3